MICNTYKVNKYHKLCNRGFTLAEILITLTIIGVVAALTVPTVVRSYQKQQYVTSLKKFYSVSCQSINLLKQETACDTSECMGFVGSVSDNDWNNMMEKQVKQIFKTIKICKYGDVSCTGHMVCQLNGKSDCENIFGVNQFSFITADGMNVRINPQVEGSKWFPLTVDVNGTKKPNLIGRDIHLFRMDTKGLIHPYCGYYYAANNGVGFNNNLYWKTNTDLCNPDSTASTGYGCTARIMESGWAMDY